MAIESSGLDAAWSSWGEALVATLFPAGLGPQQRFSFGQTTLVADFVNNDVQVINAQLYGIGDIVPATGPNFAPLASLSDAYGFFLQRFAPASVTREMGSWQQAISATATPYNMPTRSGAAVPAGMGQTVTPSDTVYLPAYLLDSGFRAKYGEWQVASTTGRTDAGGVIRVRSPSKASMALGAHGAAKVAPAPAPGFLKLRPGLAASAALQVAATAGATPTALVMPPGLAAASGNPAGAAVADDYEVTVAFTGLATFSLNPAPWFSETTIRMLSDQLSPADQAKFFGPDGILARRIYQVVLGFQPSVSLSFPDPDTHAQAQALLQAGPGGGVDVGPLSFEAGSAGVSANPGSGITMGPTPSTLPVLLGVVSTTLATPMPGSPPAAAGPAAQQEAP